MASASPYESDEAVIPGRQSGVAVLRRVFLPALRFVSFWTAVLLPFVLLTLLANGVIVERPLVAGGLLAVNLGSLVLGQEYNR